MYVLLVFWQGRGLVMAEVTSIVVLDEIALCWDIMWRGNFSPTFVCNVSRRKESWQHDVVTKLLALTAKRVEREGWSVFK
jgi:hypothetical protein